MIRCFTRLLVVNQLFLLPQVAHFSKYGLQDSDEEEDVPPKTDPKKLKTVMSLPSSRLQHQLPPSQQQVAPQAQVEPPATITLTFLIRVNEVMS